MTHDDWAVHGLGAPKKGRGMTDQEASSFADPLLWKRLQSNNTAEFCQTVPQFIKALAKKLGVIPSELQCENNLAIFYCSMDAVRLRNFGDLVFIIAGGGEHAHDRFTNFKHALNRNERQIIVLAATEPGLRAASSITVLKRNILV